MKNFIVHRDEDRKEYLVLSCGGSIRYFSCKNKNTADTVCRALQAAYDAGRREIQYNLRELLNVSERE